MEPNREGAKKSFYGERTLGSRLGCLGRPVEPLNRD